MKQHWVIIDYGGTAALVTLSKSDPNKFWWFGGVSYCTFSTDYPKIILKDYGLIDDEDDDKIDAITIEFYKNYNTRKKSKPYESGGWISPKGEFYACHFHEHDAFAKNLAAVYYNSLKGVRELEEKNWIRLGDDGMVTMKVDFTLPYTQKQLDTLFDLSQVEGASNEFVDHIKDSIELLSVD